MKDEPQIDEFVSNDLIPQTENSEDVFENVDLIVVSDAWLSNETSSCNFTILILLFKF